MPIVKLTQQFIDHELKTPASLRRVEFVDELLPGHYVEVRATSPGEGTYYLRYKDPTRKTCHQKIGSTKEMTLVQARNRAKELKAEIRLGADPRGEAKARKAVPTLTEFFEEQYRPVAQPRKRSFKSDVSLFNLRLRPKFGHLRLNEIHRREVQAFHGSLLSEGLAPATCDHYLKLMRRLMSLAVEFEVIPNNPLSRATLFLPDNRMEVYLEGESLERLVHILRTDSNRPVCLLALFLLGCGCRLAEALNANWAQIDLANKSWRIPASIAKSKRSRSVPLSEAVLDVLNQTGTKDGPVFVSAKTKGPLKQVHKVWQRLRVAAGMPKLRIHDLRHSYASALVNNGHSLYVVQQALGHASSVTSQRYSHLNSSVLHDAADSASRAILAAVAASDRKASAQIARSVQVATPCDLPDPAQPGLGQVQLALQEEVAAPAS